MENRLSGSRTWEVSMRSRETGRGARELPSFLPYLWECAVGPSDSEVYESKGWDAGFLREAIEQCSQRECEMRIWGSAEVLFPSIWCVFQVQGANNISYHVFPLFSLIIDANFDGWWWFLIADIFPTFILAPSSASSQLPWRSARMQGWPNPVQVCPTSTTSSWRIPGSRGLQLLLPAILGVMQPSFPPALRNLLCPGAWCHLFLFSSFHSLRLQILQWLFLSAQCIKLKWYLCLWIWVEKCRDLPGRMQK